MKLITLNTWCGKIYEPLKKFIIDHSNDTDIFCFQEIRNGKYLDYPERNEEVTNLYKDIEAMLPNFKGYYTEMVPGVGIATFVKNLKVEKINSSIILSTEELANINILQNMTPFPRVLQIISLKNPKISICNFHGVPGDLKKDTKERDLQTKRVLKLLNDSEEPKILVGDFNLNIDTKAIVEFGEKMKNLVKESTFKTTRSSLYERKEIMPFADYIFVSKDIKVKNFKVLPDEVSDHLALELEFD
ncbi:MAG: endonuclease/exonuclease/phosphatase family protein [bacterium]